VVVVGTSSFAGRVSARSKVQIVGVAASIASIVLLVGFGLDRLQALVIFFHIVTAKESGIGGHETGNDVIHGVRCHVSWCRDGLIALTARRTAHFVPTR
jgi:hypothetical protein